jgi:predicted flap endonuclease-1-like 5' DNA nuclease
LEWVNHVDLFRIQGVGSEYADLLEAAGVDTVPELAQRNPANLHQKLSEVNEEKQLVRHVPSLSSVEDWVEQAKSLPRKITY